MIWRGKKDRVPQPPVSAATRDPERHTFWTAAIFVVGGIILLICGATHSTGLETADGETAREMQLVKSFAVGGLQLAPRPRPPDPARYNNPAELAAAMDRFEREEREAPGIRYVVNTTAADPCPT
jgi:hypothetical protein